MSLSQGRAAYWPIIVGLVVVFFLAAALPTPAAATGLWVFTTKATIKVGAGSADDRISLRSVLALVPPDDGFDPVAEAVTIDLGGTVFDLPVGSFRQLAGKPKWKLKAGSDPALRTVLIDLAKKRLKIKARSIDLATPPVLIALAVTIGNDPGDDAFTCTARSPTTYRCSQGGSWQGPIEWPLIGVHAAVVSTGKVLHWSYPETGPGAEAWIFDPAAQALQPVPLGDGSDIFCGGHSFLGDGRLLVTGGTDDTWEGGCCAGLRATHIFDPTTDTWTVAEDMAAGRWYPTNVTLADGTVAAFSGLTENAELNTTVEHYTPGTGWQLVPGAPRELALFPFLHLLPSGEIFHAGPEELTETFDLATGSWTELASKASAHWDGGTSVLLPGLDRVLVAGGGPPAEIIDLAAPMPVWRQTAGLLRLGGHANSVLLPDGRVLLVGGGRRVTLFDPATEHWAKLAKIGKRRGEHATAVLLPDATVLAAGPDGNYTVEVFLPPYLLRGPRPVITTAPASVPYAGMFDITTPDAADVAAVALIRLAAVTHSFNQGQRYVGLAYSAAGNTLEVQAPASGNIAPPGYYMLFLLSSSGVPSVADIVHVGP